MSTVEYEKKDHHSFAKEDQQLENIKYTNPKSEHQPFGLRVDDEVAKYLDASVVIGEEENKRVLRLVSANEEGERTRRNPSSLLLTSLSPLLAAQSKSPFHHGHDLLLSDSR